MTKQTDYLEIAVFRDVSPCSLIDIHRRFKDAYYLHRQGNKRRHDSLESHKLLNQTAQRNHLE